MEKALLSLRHANPDLHSARDYKITTTHRNIKINPQSEKHLDILSQDKDLILYTYPMDREIVEGGDFYIDPDAPSDKPLPLYTTIEVDHELPEGIPYEILYNLHNPQADEDYEILQSNNRRDVSFIDLLVNESWRIIGESKQSTTRGASSAKYYPSGLIRTYDSSKGNYVGIYGLKIRYRRGLFPKYAFTNRYGTFRVNKSYSRSISYDFNFERYDFKITTPGRSHPVGVTTAHTRSSLRLNFSRSDIRSYYATIFRAAHHYYHEYIKSLSRPPQNSLLGRQLKIEAFKGTDPEGSLATHKAVNTTFSRTSLLKIYDSSRETKITYGAVIHELAHAAHWRLGKKDDFRYASSKVQESWATGVEWSLTSTIYSDYQSNNFKPLYTGVVQDMIDSDTKFSIDSTDDDTKNELKDRREYVVGYTISQIEAALKGKRTWTSWRDNIKAKYNNATEHHLDPLFQLWN